MSGSSFLEECTVLFENAGFEMKSRRAAVQVAKCFHRRLCHPNRPGRYPDDRGDTTGLAQSELEEVHNTWESYLQCLTAFSPMTEFARLLPGLSVASTDTLFVAMVYSAINTRETFSTTCWIQRELLRKLLETGAPIPRFLHTDVPSVDSSNFGMKVFGIADIAKSEEDDCIVRHGNNVLCSIAMEAVRRRDPLSTTSSRPPSFTAPSHVLEFDVDSTGWSVDSKRCVWVTACLSLGFLKEDHDHQGSEES